MHIRVARSDDWPAIFAFFSRIVADGQSYAFPAGLTEQNAVGWWMEASPGQTVVAVDGDDGGTVLGSAKMGPNRPGRGSHVATASFMVDPVHQGRGIGRALGEYVVSWGRRTGYHAIQFNAVVETNTAAIDLWRSLGFDVLATVPEAFDHPQFGYVGLLVMYQKL